MNKMCGVVVVLYVRNYFVGIKKIWVLYGRHNSPKRTIIKIISMDVIHHHRGRQWHLSWHYFSPLCLSTIHEPFLFFFCILAGGMVFAVVVIRLGPFRFKGFLGCILGVDEAFCLDSGFTWRHSFSLPHDVTILC